MTTAAPSSPVSPSRRKPLLLFTFVLVAVAVAAAGAYYWQVARFYEDTDDAYVATNVIEVTPQVSGTVRAVDVRDTEPSP